GPAVEVRKMGSSQTLGLDSRCPGSLNRQATFLISVHSVGRPVSELWPSFLGPRHCGQFSARANGAAAAAATRTAKRVRRVTGGSRNRCNGLRKPVTLYLERATQQGLDATGKTASVRTALDFLPFGKNNIAR